MTTVEVSVNSNAEETFVIDNRCKDKKESSGLMLKYNLQKYIKTYKKQFVIIFCILVMMLLMALTLNFKNIYL
jgi:hypothetical protein